MAKELEVPMHAEGNADRFSRLVLEDDCRHDVAFACGALGFPERIAMRARLGERQALGLLARLIERRGDGMAVRLCGERVRRLLEGRPMVYGERVKRSRELIDARNKALYSRKVIR